MKITTRSTLISHIFGLLVFISENKKQYYLIIFNLLNQTERNENKLKTNPDLMYTSLFCRIPAHFFSIFFSVDGGESQVGLQKRKMFSEALPEENTSMQKYPKRLHFSGRTFGLENQTFQQW